MKKIILTAIVLSGILISGCQKDLPDATTDQQQDVVFNIGQAEKGLKNDYMDCALEADYALIYLDGVTDPMVVPVFYVNEVMYTQALKMDVGSYSLTDFMLYQQVGDVDDYTDLEYEYDDVLLSATPLDGSEYAPYVDDPLPITFTVDEFTKREIPVSILCYTPQEFDAFGFTWFRVDMKDLEEGLFFGDFCVDDFTAYTGTIYGDYPKVDMPAIFQIVLSYDKDGDGDYETVVGTYNNEADYLNTETDASVSPLSIKYVNHPDVDDFYRLDVYIMQIVEVDPQPEEPVLEYKYFETWYFTNDIDIMTKGIGDDPEDNEPGTETVGPGNDGVYDFIVGDCTIIEWDIDVNDPEYGDGINNETAYAYGEENAYCFTSFGFGNWGWSNLIINSVGEEYELPIWAGVGQCDIQNKGWHVGTLTVHITAADKADITYTVFPGYQIEEAQLYVGLTKAVERHNGHLTVAPGQYPYKQEDLGGVSPVSFTVEIPVGEDFYLIAHSVVAGMH